MSADALTWSYHIARELRLAPTPRVVLQELAYATHPETGVAWPAMSTLAERCNISAATAKRTIKELEAAGVLEVRHRTNARGSSDSNVYKLRVRTVHAVGEHRVAVRPSSVADDPVLGPAILGVQSEPPVQSEPGAQSEPPVNLNGDGVQSDPQKTEPKDIPPVRAKALPAPTGAKRGTRIPEEGLAMPPPADATASIQRLIGQWPAGAYETEWDAFVAYWQGEGGAKASKRDWRKTWWNRCAQITGRVLRDAKAGVDFSPPRPASKELPVFERAGECGIARAIRASLREEIGAVYDSWFTNACFQVKGGQVRVIAPSHFTAEFITNNFTTYLQIAAKRALASQFAGVQIAASKIARDVRSENDPTRLAA